jgi:hypothetical protein
VQVTAERREGDVDTGRVEARHDRPDHDHRRDHEDSVFEPPPVSDAVAAGVILRPLTRGFEVRLEPLAQLRVRHGAHQAVHL